jgi:caffeoyl-CoA O-methyltransferase
MTDKAIRFCDKLLPNQPEYAHDYRGADHALALYEMICRSSGIRDPHDEFKVEDSDRFTQAEMGSNPVSLRFLQVLIRIAGVNRVLEIGTFVGVSAMYFAEALPPGGEVVTIEKFDHFATIARRNFAANGLSDRIRLLEGDAFEVIEKLPRDKLFDLIFIDGNKERYVDYFRKTEPLLSRHGLVLVDDCFFHGDALNASPTNEKGRGTRAFLDYAATRNDYQRIALPLSNGIMIMRRTTI